MIIIIVLLSLLSIALGTGLYLSLKALKQHHDKIIEVADAVENSLDMLDACYQRVAAHSVREVFSDEPVVKELVQDIKTSRDAILLVANLIIEPFQNDEESNG